MVGVAIPTVALGKAILTTLVDQVKDLTITGISINMVKSDNLVFPC